MPLIQDLSRSQLVFQVVGGDVDRFQVVRYRGTEGLCQLYRFEIELVSTEADIALDEIVGQAAVLSVATGQGERWFHGLVSRFEVTGQSVGQTHFRAELVPSVWLLTQRYNSRIFQDKTVKDIITDVLTKAGIASDRFKFALERDYQPREYCVQYRESDYNFIARLMEEEGIWWYFEQMQQAHVLVLADSITAYEPLEGDPTLPFVPPSGLLNETEHVFRFRLGQAVRPGAVVLNDFNFKKPSLTLEARGTSTGDAALEFFDYPGEYVEQAAGYELAEIRAQEFASRRVVGVGQCTSHHFAAGRTFELIEHPVTSLNGSYLITALTHSGKQATLGTTTGSDGRASILDARVHQSLIAARGSEDQTIRELAEGLLQIAHRLRPGDPTAHRALSDWVYHAGQVSRDLASLAASAGASPLEALSLRNLVEDVAQSGLIDYDAPLYECRFECIPEATPYRPPRITPWPVMRGSQTARVVGPPGEEICTDEYGRVKVQFNWDRAGKFDEHSSCWIRVAQGSAGGQYGMLFLPRIGQEVIVDFLEGDADQPIITGRVYNADQMPPYKLPDEKTKSVIKTNSSQGGGGTNELRFEDLKDSEQILIHAQKDLHVRVKHDRVENVSRDCHLTVDGRKLELVKKAKHSEVRLDFKEKIGGDKSQEVKGKASVKVAGTQSTQVGGDVVEQLGANHKHEVSLTYACKGTSIKLEAATGIELKCGGSSLVLTPTAIFIVGGPLVNINNGSGPPVGPVSAQLATPEAPEAPATADDVKLGKDVKYSGGQELAAGQVPGDVAGYEHSPEKTAEKKTSWIEIELVDEAGQPVPDERYEITAPDGQTIVRGTLDSQGRAHVSIADPGNCQISFTKLHPAAWERL